MIHFLGLGMILGLSAGFSPGPLLMLVISETLRHGTGSGMKVALAPVITDLPIILIALFLLLRLSASNYILGAIALAGGMFLLFTGYDSIRSRAVELALPQAQPRSLAKGVLTNFLSPHPYLFWLTVGAPELTKSLAIGTTPFLAFLAGFYLSLVGAKLALAVAAGRSKLFLSSRAYLYTLRLLGFLLVAFAVMLFREGLALLGFV